MTYTTAKILSGFIVLFAFTSNYGMQKLAAVLTYGQKTTAKTKFDYKKFAQQDPFLSKRSKFVTTTSHDDNDFIQAIKSESEDNPADVSDDTLYRRVKTIKKQVKSEELSPGKQQAINNWWKDFGDRQKKTNMRQPIFTSEDVTSAVQTHSLPENDQTASSVQATPKTSPAKTKSSPTIKPGGLKDSEFIAYLKENGQELSKYAKRIKQMHKKISDRKSKLTQPEQEWIITKFNELYPNKVKASAPAAEQSIATSKRVFFSLKNGLIATGVITLGILIAYKIKNNQKNQKQA